MNFLPLGLAIKSIYGHCSKLEINCFLGDVITRMYSRYFVLYFVVPYFLQVVVSVVCQSLFLLCKAAVSYRPNLPSCYL